MKEIIEKIEEVYGLKITDKSFKDIPLFDLPIHQPFKFNIEINYCSIKSKSCFELHFPSLYINGNKIKEFTEEIIRVKDIINMLNYELKNNFSSEWILQ